MEKDICVKLKQLLGHAVQGDPTNLASQLHLKEKQEDRHIRVDVEEMAQDFKSSHHCPTVWVELRRGHIQVLKQSLLESGKGENKTQDLKKTCIHKKEGQTARRRL